MRTNPNDTERIQTVSNRIEEKRRELNRMEYLGRSFFGEKIRVSFFENYRNPNPIGVVEVFGWLSSSRYRKEIEALRSERDEGKRRLMKSLLPAITPSGTFSHRRNSGLVQYSGLICLDIDQKDNPLISDFSAIKGTLVDFEGLTYCALSASGSGLFMLVKVAYPEKHLEHFYSLERDFKERGLTVDTACKDVARLRGATYDPHPYYNPLASPYEKTLIPDVKPAPSTDLPDSGVTAYRVKRLIERIEHVGADVVNSYQDWYATGRALASEFGEFGRGLFHNISRQSLKYDPHQCDLQFNRCLQTCSRTTIATLFAICKQHGIYAK